MENIIVAATATLVVRLYDYEDCADLYCLLHNATQTTYLTIVKFDMLPFPSVPKTYKHYKLNRIKWPKGWLLYAYIFIAMSTRCFMGLLAG